MTPQQLKNSILQRAIEGRLVEQRPTEGTAKELLKKIQAEKARLVEEGKIKKPKALPPITEEEKPFDIPEGWVWCYLNDIAFITKLAGFEYSKYISPNLSLNGIPLFKGKNIQNGTLVENFEGYIPETVSDELFRSQLTKRCLLTPYVGTIGNIAIFEGKYKAHIGSNVGKIELFNEDGMHVLEEYVLFYLRSNTGYKELTKYKKATAQESISIDAIRNVLIPLPSLAEQRRIVAKIEEFLPLIDKYDKAYTKLTDFNTRFPEAMKKSLLQYAIEGKLVEQRADEGTAQDLIKDIQAEKKRLIAEKKIKKPKALPPITEEEIPFDIPESWKWVRLLDIAEGGLGKTLNKSKDKGIEKPYLCSINVYWDGINLEKVKTALFDVESQKKYLLKKGDLLICEGGDAGRSAVWDNEDEMYYQNALHRIRFYGGINPYYFLYCLELFKAQGVIEAHCKGVTIKHLVQSSLNEIIFPLPPLSEQHRIVTKLEELLPFCDQLRNKQN